jgi:hypothetical protein
MRKFKRFLLLFLAAAALQAAVSAAGSQPVFIVLYSRFYDHSHPFPNNQRVDRLIPLLERLRAKYPNSGVACLFEFSGAISQVFLEYNPSQHGVDKIKEAAKKGLIDIGYTGEEEPSYLYRPRPDFISAETPEQRWTAISEAAERFLTDFKDPVTGRPVPGLTGGLKGMQEVFGEAAFVRGVSETLGGDAAVTNQVRKLNANAMMLGVPPQDTRRGIEGYAASAAGFAKTMSPGSDTAPEVFWQDGMLRISDLSLTDNKPHSTDEPVDVLKKVFAGLDRSKVRVIALEFGSYKRYLAKRPDQSVIWDPMEWLYYHPENPQFPPTMKPFLVESAVAAGYKNEEAVMNWLLGEYLPANPGSRILSIGDLKKMAGPERPSEVTWDQVKTLATDFENRFKPYPTRLVDYLKAGDRYFSNAEAFTLMAEALSTVEKSGAPSPSIKPLPVNAPISVPNDMGPIKGTVIERDVLQAAAQVVAPLRNTEWKVIPENAIPPYVQVGAVRVNATQFLRLMALSCLDLSPDKVLPLSPIALHSVAMFAYPKNTPIMDQGMGWTLKPATLHFASTGTSAGGQ